MSMAETPEEEIDRKLQEAEQAKEEVAAELKVADPSDPFNVAPAVDEKGRQLRFEGLKVDGIVTQLNGNVKLTNIGKLPLRKTYRFEVYAKVEETRFKDDKQLDRIQVLRVLNAELIEEWDNPFDSKEEEE